MRLWSGSGERQSQNLLAGRAFMNLAKKVMWHFKLLLAAWTSYLNIAHPSSLF
jgi:hypothetical protein